MSGPDELPQALERLVALGQSPDVNIRPVLLRVVVDMFVRKSHHADADLQQFETITLHLLDDADIEARLIVADKLSRHPQTPRALLDRFVAEQGSIATKVYQHAVLDEGTLTAAASWGSLDTALAIARRRDLPSETVAALVDRPEPEIAHALADNAEAPLDRPDFQKLARRARSDTALARALAGRALDPLDLAPLFAVLTGEQRLSIIEAARRADLGKRQWGRPEAGTGPALERMDRLMRAGERDGFDMALCIALDIEAELLLPIIHDEGAEGLALALAATGASPELAARIFILGDPRVGRSVEKVRALVAIVETISALAARRLIDAMTGTALHKRRPSLDSTQASARRLDHPSAQHDAATVRWETTQPALPKKTG